MFFYLESILNGLLFGASYSLVAIGFTVIFRVIHKLNVAHGATIMVSAYAGMTVTILLVGDSYVVLLLAFAVSVAAFVVASALASAAGCLIGMSTGTVAPFMGSHLLVVSFVVIVLGGFGNVYGAMIGGILIGVLETLTVAAFLATYKQAVLSHKLATVGERKSDWEFMMGLGRTLGYEEYFPSLKALADEALRPMGIAWDELKKHDYVPIPIEYRTYGKVGFGTPTGKFEIWSTVIQDWGYDSLPSHVEAAGYVNGLIARYFLPK